MVDAARARVAELTANGAPLEQIAVAEEAYEVAKAAQKDMITLARDNEARVEELESVARAALLLEQTVLPALATTTEATTTLTVLPVDVATSTAPTIAVPATEASTTVAVPEPVVPTPPAPTPEVAAPVAPEQAVAPSTPEAVTAPARPVTFIGATGQVVLSAFKDFAPLAFAKKSKAKPAKKKSPPPLPKKSKAKAAPPPSKVTKQAKVTKASKDLASLSKSVAKLTAAVASLNKTIAIQKPIVLPALAKVAQATKVQAAKIVVAPQVASTKKDAVSKLTSSALIQQAGTIFTSSYSNAVATAMKSFVGTQKTLCSGGAGSASCIMGSFVTDTGKNVAVALGKKDEKGNTVTTGTQVLAIGMVGMDASGGGGVYKGLFKSPALSTLVTNDVRLSNIVQSLYKGFGSQRQIGSGSTADAIRNELITGKATEDIFHSIKGQQSINALNNWLREMPNAAASDKELAKKLIQDLSNALSGK